MCSVCPCAPVCPVRVPCVSRLPPVCGVFLPVPVRVIRVPACARVSRVSRVCPGSPRCIFTGTVQYRVRVCPGSPRSPGVFLPGTGTYRTTPVSF